MGKAARRCLPAALTLAWAMGLPSAGSAQQGAGGQGPTAAALGQVVDRDTGAPIEGAFVSFEGERRGVYTDARGIFVLRDGKEGRERVTIEMLGYGIAFVPADLVDQSPPVRIPLRADPVVLEGIEIVADRFRRRRNAVATSVRVFDTRQLRMSPTLDAMQFVESRTFIREARCELTPAAWASHRTCVRSRGRVVAAVVCVDEAPMLGGLDMLRSISPADLHMVEVYGGGRSVQIRVYTRAFMERASRTRLNPVPIEFGC